MQQGRRTATDSLVAVTERQPWSPCTRRQGKAKTGASQLDTWALSAHARPAHSPRKQRGDDLCTGTLGYCWGSPCLENKHPLGETAAGVSRHLPPCFLQAHTRLIWESKLPQGSTPPAREVRWYGRWHGMQKKPLWTVQCRRIALRDRCFNPVWLPLPRCQPEAHSSA